MKILPQSAVVFGLICFIVSPSTLAGLTPDQEIAKTTGIALFNQYKAISAVPHLKIAAHAGDHEAQYYLGEAIRNNKRYMTTEAQTAYEASAAMGDVYSMIRLGQASDDLCVKMNHCPKAQKTPEQWTDLANKTANQGVERGNAESMYLMYKITGDDEWIEKSAENGFALAQFRLATKYQDGGGVFLLRGQRADAIERWMKASAENGYPPGMMGLAAIYIEKKISKISDFGTKRPPILAMSKQFLAMDLIWEMTNPRLDLYKI